MTTFQIPQFINQKPRILGPLTIAQFAYIVLACIISFILYTLLSFAAWIIATLIIAITTIAFVFVKIGGLPLTTMITHLIRHIWQNRTYTWQRTNKEEVIDTSAIDRVEKIRKNLEVKSRLKSLEAKVLNSTKKSSAIKNQQVVTYLTGEKKVAKRIDYK